MTRVAVVLKEYKEIVLLLIALGGLAYTSPRINNTDADGRLSAIQRQLDALVRLECVTAAVDKLTLAGVSCAGILQPGRVR